MKRIILWASLGIWAISSHSFAQIRPTSVTCEVEPLYGYRTDGQRDVWFRYI